MPPHIILGASLAALTALLGLRARALSLDGALAAAVVGTLVFAGGGVAWAAVMMSFFVSSSALSKLSPASSSAGALITEKSDRRDAFQVLANGGIPAVLAIASAIHPNGVWTAGFTAAMAAATADTWATEIGSLSRSPPRHLLSGRSVPAGTSGAITTLGIYASAAGSLFICCIAALVSDLGWLLTAFVATAGFGGSLADSILGATLQEIRYCPTCQIRTEQSQHRFCGTFTVHTGGIRGFDNDLVNLLSCAGSASSALLVALTYRVLA